MSKTFDIELDVCVNRGLTWPAYTTNLDKATIINDGQDVKVIKHTGSVSKNVTLEYVSKRQEETVVEDGKIVRDQSIEIQHLWIDGIKLPVHMIEKLSLYYPAYRPDFLEYCKTQSISVDYGPLHNIKFWHAGTWSILLDSDFWFKYKVIKQPDSGTDFTGNSSEEIKQSLERIKSLL